MMPRPCEPADCVRIDLGDDQGDVLVAPEMRRIVDNHAAGRGSLRRIEGRDIPAGGEQSDLRSGEVKVRQVADRV
jgi:hypothetical protein